MNQCFTKRTDVSQETIWGLQLLLDNLAISPSARVEISPVLIPHLKSWWILTRPIFNNSQTCPPVLPRPYCLPSTKPASQSVLEFICCNQIYIWDNMIILTVWIQSPHDDPWTSLPDDPVIEASTIDEPHSSFSVLPQVEPGGIVCVLSSCDP